MKNLFQYLLIIILFSTLGIILTNQEQFRDLAYEARRYIYPPCNKPMEYSIGIMDPKFGVSHGELREHIVRAEKIWEDAIGRNLFEYAPAAEFKVNLVFDQREQQTLEAQELEENLGKLEVDHSSTVDKYNMLSANLDKRLAAYNTKVADYENKLADYNRDVQKWNSRGGASEDEFEDLKDEKASLVKMQSELEKERTAINDLARKADSVVEEENKIADRYNDSLGNYQSAYGTTREFEKGLFNGHEINIYEFKEKEDLEMTLIHEFGHALGIGHMKQPKSIMYYLIGEQDLENPQLSEEDMAALDEVCNIKK